MAMQHFQLSATADNQPQEMFNTTSTQLSPPSFPGLEWGELVDTQPEKPANNLYASIHAPKHIFV